MPASGRSLTVWLTGLPSSGKSTVANGIAKRLMERGLAVEVLDGDEIRKELSQDLGFSRADREQNMRRVGWVADLLSRNGVVAVCALVSPYEAVRDEIRRQHGDRFFEVYVAAPRDVCERRDDKGLYARQRRGEIAGLTGVDDPYEPPERPELVLLTHEQTEAESIDALWHAIAHRLIDGGAGGATP